MIETVVEFMADKDELFMQEMADVKPLAITERTSVTPNKPDGNIAARRAAATAQPQQEDRNTLQSGEVDRVGPHDILGYKRPGIQDGVFRKLRLGKYPCEARLDLHRRTVEEARQEVFRFVSDCLAADIRSVIVMPGKGDRNLKDPGVLKSYLVHWLTELEPVQAFHTTQPQHGGSGAFYVLLRKSERKKQLAREQFSKGRVD